MRQLTTRGVRKRTAEGEVFLGHCEPEKIVRDSDLVINHKRTRRSTKDLSVSS